MGLPGGSVGKESACNARDLGSIPGLGRSPGEGNSYLLQYSGLENSMNCKVHGVTKSQTQLSSFYFHSFKYILLTPGTSNPHKECELSCSRLPLSWEVGGGNRVSSNATEWS